MKKIFCFDPTTTDSQAKVRGIGRYLQILKENFPNWHFSNKLNLAKKSLPDIFIHPFFNFLEPPLTLKRLFKKQIAIIHDLIPLKYKKNFPVGLRGRLNIFLNKIALNNYDTIITDSYQSKKDITKILSIEEKKIKVVYPCLPKIFSQKNKTNNLKLKKNLENFNFPLPSNFCLYVGDATWNKNLVNLAKAIKIINVPCLFVGKVFQSPVIQPPRLDNIHPWQLEFKQFLKEVAGDKRFIFTGFIKDYGLIKLYKQAKCNILVSRDEGFGFSYLEAANFGTASVLSKISVFEEIAQKSALFADPNNPNDIADKIGEIYFNDNLKNKIGFEAQKRSQYFSRENFKKSFFSILNE